MFPLKMSCFFCVSVEDLHGHVYSGFYPKPASPLCQSGKLKGCKGFSFQTVRICQTILYNQYDSAD